MLNIQFFILQAIVFAAVIYFLKKILYGDTQGAINRLEAVHQDLLSKQKELTAKIEAGEKEYLAKKDEANALADKMSTQAMEEIRTKEGEVLKKARQEAEEILNKAQASRDQFYHDIEVEVNKKTIDFAGELLKQVFPKRTIGVIHQEMIQDFVDHLKEADLGSVGSGVQEMIVRTPFALKKEESEKLSGVVITKLNRTIKLQEVLDEELVAGLVLQFGTLILDGSFKSTVKEVANLKKDKII